MRRAVTSLADTSQFGGEELGGIRPSACTIYHKAMFFHVSTLWTFRTAIANKYLGGSNR